MKIKATLITIFCSLTTVFISAQHHEESHESTQVHESQNLPDEQHHGKHKIAIYGGFTHVDAAFYEHETSEESTGKWVPTLGIDYFYALNDKFHLAFIGDIELDSYYIKHGDESDLERSNVLVLTPMGIYKLTHNIGLGLGAGVEIEFASHVKYLAVIKAGIEYEVPITKGWELTPSFTFDYKEEYSTFAFGMSLGKRF